MINIEEINKKETRLEVLNVVSDACKYYNYSVGDNFDLMKESELLKRDKSNNCEDELLINIFETAKSRIDKLEKRNSKND